MARVTRTAGHAIELLKAPRICQITGDPLEPPHPGPRPNFQGKANYAPNARLRPPPASARARSRSPTGEVPREIHAHIEPETAAV
jgi:hypothetical protein